MDNQFNGVVIKDKWKKLKYFTPDEAWGDPDKMDSHLLFYLDGLRKFIKHKIIIHCGTQGAHCRNSYHYQGLAVDCHAEDISLLAFYLASERFPFGGIGIYPTWHNKGLHLDIRPVYYGRKPEARWAKVHNLYVDLSDEFVRRHLINETTG